MLRELLKRVIYMLPRNCMEVAAGSYIFPKFGLYRWEIRKVGWFVIVLIVPLTKFFSLNNKINENTWTCVLCSFFFVSRFAQRCITKNEN